MKWLGLRHLKALYSKILTLEKKKKDMATKIKIKEKQIKTI